MSSQNTILKKECGIARLTINRPNSLNSLNRETVEEIRRALEELRASIDVRVLVISGAGGEAFSVGADLKGGLFSLLTTQSEAIELSELGHSTLGMIEDFEKPVIAAVDGYALGGGFELALACDLIIASDRAMFGLPEVNLGIIPGWGGTQRLARLIGRNRAKLLIFTGDMISAKEAKQIGVVNMVVPSLDFQKSVDELAKQLSSKSCIALGLAKFAINKGLKAGIEEGMRYESEALGTCFGTKDHKERLKAFLERRIRS